MGERGRYVIYGAGAIGGTIAARLQALGQRVVVIARGQTREVLERDGLKLMTESGTQVARFAVVGNPAELALTREDTVILAMKTQDTLPAVQELAGAAPADMPVFCAQNGVENERIAQRLFMNVYGMSVFMFTSTLVAGEVRCYTEPSLGILDLGCVSGAPDATALSVARDLAAAGFDSVARPDIMRWKYGKLLANLGNALTASYGDSSKEPDLYEAVQEEGRQCMRAAGIPFASRAEMDARKLHLLPLKQVGGAPFPGSSSWQSLARGSGQTEVDYLSGEVVLLGRQTGTPTPLNLALQLQVREMAILKKKPGSLDPNELRTRHGMPAQPRIQS